MGKTGVVAELDSACRWRIFAYRVGEAENTFLSGADDYANVHGAGARNGLWLATWRAYRVELSCRWCVWFSGVCEYACAEYWACLYDGSDRRIFTRVRAGDSGCGLFGRIGLESTRGEHFFRYADG